MNGSHFKWPYLDTITVKMSHLFVNFLWGFSVSVGRRFFSCDVWGRCNAAGWLNCLVPVGPAQIKRKKRYGMFPYFLGKSGTMSALVTALCIKILFNYRKLVYWWPGGTGGCTFKQGAMFNPNKGCIFLHFSNGCCVDCADNGFWCFCNVCIKRRSGFWYCLITAHEIAWAAEDEQLIINPIDWQ